MALSCVATCPLGIEELLERELRELGMSRVRRERSAVTFVGGWGDVYRANWRLRTANRLLVELGSWGGATGEALAAGASELAGSTREWDGVRARDLFAPGRSFAIRATSSRSRQNDRRWIALKVKDGLVDAQRVRYGERGSIDRREPDLSFRVRLDRDRATFLLDTSGDSLDHRGYRVDRGVPAPLREHLAAACVLAAVYEGEGREALAGIGAVVDPMCGSGTLLAEAAAWARGLAPGRAREGWGLESLPGFDRELWRRVREEPIPAPAPEVRLYGVDREKPAVRAARANLERAGLAGISTLVAGDAFAYRPPPGPGLLLVNPPYGERMEMDGGGSSREAWRRVGDLLKQRYSGWRAVVIAGDEGKGKHVGLRPARRMPVRNGPLDARILVFDVY